MSDCPICQAVNGSIYKIVDGYPVWRCRNCDLYWVPDVSDEVIAEFYSGQYFRGDHDTGYGDYLSTEKAQRLSARLLLDTIRTRSHRRSAATTKLIDVGCAHGFLVDEAVKAGFDAEGIDVSEEAGAYARNKLGLRIAHGTLHSAGVPSDTFDVATSIGSIEHLNNPIAVATEIHRVLKPGGLLVITTVDTGSRVGFRLKPPEHLFYFSRANIGHMLEGIGFDVDLARSYSPYHIVGETLGLITIGVLGKRANPIARLLKVLPGSRLCLRFPVNEMLVVARKRG